MRTLRFVTGFLLAMLLCSTPLLFPGVGGTSGGSGVGGTDSDRTWTQAQINAATGGVGTAYKAADVNVATNATNYAASVAGTAATEGSNYTDSVAGTVGAGGTNYTDGLIQGMTSYVDSSAGTVGSAATNYTDAAATAGSNYVRATAFLIDSNNTAAANTTNTMIVLKATQVGIGGLATFPLSVVDAATQIQYGATPTNGGFFLSTVASQNVQCGGSYFSGGNWIAAAEQSEQVAMTGGEIVFRCDTGLTPYGAFTPTARATLNTTSFTVTVPATFTNLTANGNSNIPVVSNITKLVFGDATEQTTAATGSGSGNIHGSSNNTFAASGALTIDTIVLGTNSANTTFPMQMQNNSRGSDKRAVAAYRVAVGTTGLVCWSEAGVDDRWSYGLISGDSRLWFGTSRGTGWSPKIAFTNDALILPSGGKIYPAGTAGMVSNMDRLAFSDGTLQNTAARNGTLASMKVSLGAKVFFADAAETIVPFDTLDWIAGSAANSLTNGVGGTNWIYQTGGYRLHTEHTLLATNSFTAGTSIGCIINTNGAYAFLKKANGDLATKRCWPGASDTLYLLSNTYITVSLFPSLGHGCTNEIDVYYKSRLVIERVW